VADLTARSYGDDDAAVVTELINAIEVAGDGGHRFNEDEIRGMVSGTRDPARDSRLVFTADGALAAAGIVSPPTPGTSRVHADGGVHPHSRGRGIGRELLAWQFRRAAEIRAAQDPATVWTVGTGAGVADESAARLFGRFGLQLVRYFLEMSAPTAGDRQVPLPDGIRIAAFTDGLRGAIYDSYLEAFAENWGHEPRGIEEWSVRTVGSVAFRGDLSHVAFDGHQIAAFLLAYDGPDNCLYVGQVGTRQPWRKRGLASSLIACSLASAAADGKATAGLTVDAANPTGAAGVYGRLGFTVQRSPYAVYDGALPT
jgi:mycothiol synthase